MNGALTTPVLKYTENPLFGTTVFAAFFATNETTKLPAEVNWHSEKVELAGIAIATAILPELVN